MCYKVHDLSEGKILSHLLFMKLCIVDVFDSIASKCLVSSKKNKLTHTNDEKHEWSISGTVHIHLLPHIAIQNHMFVAPSSLRQGKTM